jgi:hypothetical protein
VLKTNSDVNQEKVKRLKTHLSRAWVIAYQLETEAIENDNGELAEFFAKMNSTINRLECQLHRFVEE